MERVQFINTNRYLSKLMYDNNDIDVVMGFYGLLGKSLNYDSIVAPKDSSCKPEGFFAELRKVTAEDCSYYDCDGHCAAALRFYEFYLKCKYKERQMNK